MSSVLNFPSYAAACLRMARDEGTVERRAELLELAETWLKLFEQHRRDAGLVETADVFSEAFEEAAAVPTLH